MRLTAGAFSWYGFAMIPEEPVQIPAPATPEMTWVDRVQALFEVLLVAGLLSSLLASLPFALNPTTRANLLVDIHVISAYILLEAGLTLGFLFLVLRANRERLRDYGLFGKQWRTNVFWGLSVVPLLLMLNFVVSVAFQHFFPRSYMESNPLMELIRTPRDLALFITMALIAGGIKEELQRAFILRRFQTHLGGAWLGLVLWSVFFGLGHYFQGTQAILAAGLFGLIFGLLYLARRNLVAPMVAHGVYDTLALLGYWFLSK
jgi:uncharacterized protein